MLRFPGIVGGREGREAAQRPEGQDLGEYGPHAVVKKEALGQIKVCLWRLQI